MLDGKLTQLLLSRRAFLKRGATAACLSAGGKRCAELLCFFAPGNASIGTAAQSGVSDKGSEQALTPAQSPFDFRYYLERTRAKYDLPALSALVLKDGTVIAKGAVGERIYGTGNRVTLDDRLLLGSCSKSFGATIAAVLIERGYLRWNTTLEQAFPELRESMRPEFRKVTLAHLLAHTAGFHNVLPPVSAGPFRDSAQDGLGEDHQRRYDFAVKALITAPEFAPGTRYSYSNIGPVVAALMAERMSGTGWERLLRTCIFEPLGMRTAGIERPEPIGGRTQPWGHSRQGNRWVPTQMHISSAFYAASGGVFCSIEDWAKYIQFHLSGSETLRLNDYSRRALHKPPYPAISSGYAMGWSVGRFPWSDSEDVIYHGGGNGMQTAMVWAIPSRNFAVLFHVNAEGSQIEEAKQTVLLEMVRQYLGPVDDSVSLTVGDARLTGSLVLNSATGSVGGGEWRDPKSTLTWEIQTLAPGAYRIEVMYALPRGITGEYEVQVADHAFRKKTANTETWDQVHSDDIGPVIISGKEPVTVTLRQVTSHTTFIAIFGVLMKRTESASAR